jgi:hypothetical protein
LTHDKQVLARYVGRCDRCGFGERATVVFAAPHAADSDDDKKENEEDAPRTQKRGRSESECEPEASNKLSCYDDADIKREPSPYKNQVRWRRDRPDD